MTDQPPADSDSTDVTRRPPAQPGPLPPPQGSAPAAKDPPRQLNAWHVLASAVVGILIVLIASEIALRRAHPSTPDQWDDVVRAVVLAIAAVGAVPAAYVAYRKQRFTEADHRIESDKLKLETTKEENRRTDLADANERRQQELADANDRRVQEIDAANLRADAKAFSDRFTVVANQIGSEKAPVRLAGVYAMAQLADEWGRTDSPQRQTCIDVLCAYLRLPWLAGPFGAQTNRGSQLGRERSRQRQLAGRASPPLRNVTSLRTGEEETRVRETILRVIAAHVHADRTVDPWHELDFDLTGAVLPHLDFRDTVLKGLFNLTGATLTGRALFQHASFTHYALFFDATFTRDADFYQASFANTAQFGGAVCRYARFEEAKFSAFAGFRDTHFAGLGASFARATFDGPAEFSQATFAELGDFDGAAFNHNALFFDATFDGDAHFARATFPQAVALHGATVRGVVVGLDSSESQATRTPRPLGPLLGFPDEDDDDDPTSP